MSHWSKALGFGLAVAATFAAFAAAASLALGSVEALRRERARDPVHLLDHRHHAQRGTTQGT